MTLLRILTAVIAIVCAGLTACASVPAGPGTIQADDGDWPSYGRDYSNRRFSPLSQIDRENVGRLALRWEYRSGVSATFQATPIVVGGVMFLALPFNHVVALDARSGRQLWRYQHQRRPDRAMCCGPANRGVAVADGKVFIGTVDARLIALDARSGQKLWDIDVVGDSVTRAEVVGSLSDADPLSRARVTGATGEGVNMAPIVYGNKVIVGITGVGYGLHLDGPREDAPLGAVVGVVGRYGRPGFLAAYDVADGKRIWQFDTIPDQGWEGSYASTTPFGVPLNRDTDAERRSEAKYADAWRYGGGSAWSTPAIDPASGMLFFGTGNPSPQMDDISRPGDNLYTVSLVALDVYNGNRRWHYQQVPHDIWGYDVASPPVLFDLQRDGKRIAVVGQASKLGWFFVHRRDNGELLLQSEALVPQHNLFARATVDGVRVHPGVVGGVNWSPAALDQDRRLAFVAAIHMPMRYTLHDTPASGGKPAIRYSVLEPIEEPRWGLLSAIDLQSGRIRWQHRTDQPLIGGVLATAGGLVFMGEGDGNFDAFDSETGRLLWQHKSEAGVNAPPITYQIDGVQYVAVAVGGNQLFGYKQGDYLKVYALP